MDTEGTFRPQRIDQGTLGPASPQGEQGPQGPKGDPGPQGQPGPPTPEPARTATLIVKKHVESSEGGLAAEDFTLHVSGNNALPSEFHPSEDGIVVKMAEGQANFYNSYPLSD